MIRFLICGVLMVLALREPTPLAAPSSADEVGYAGATEASAVFRSAVAPPDPPTNLSGTVVGSTVSLTWSPPAGGTPPTSYLIEAALTAGGPVAASLPLAPSSVSIPGVPSGTYFLRVRSVNVEGASPASNEISVTVGVGACNSAPAAPVNLTGSVSGSLVAIGWAAGAGGCPATGFLVRAGSAPGVVDLANLPVGNVAGLQATAPPGTYFLSVAAQNAFGTSAPSNEITLTVLPSCTIPGAPTAFAVGSSGSTATMSWAPPTSGGTPTNYLLEAGTAPGLANLASVPVVGLALSADAPPGTYYLRVKGQNACGVGPASNEQTLTMGCAAPGQPAPPGVSVAGSTANLSWAAVAGATSYRIAVGTAVGASNVLNTVITGTTHQLTLLPTGTYFARVTALNACGSGSASGEVTFAITGGGGKKVAGHGAKR